MSDLDRLIGEHMYHLATETLMTPYGVIPPHPPAPAMKAPCDDKYSDAGIFCQRDKDHDGDHEGVTWVTWPQDDP